MAESTDMGLVSSKDAIEAQERAIVDLQISTAKQYPRVMSKVCERVLELATCNRETAEGCWYALPRDGKTIDGPSVRLAEILASSYGNLRTATRVIAIEEKFVTVQGACHDLENNVAATAEVKRRITKKNGQRFNDDMVLVTANAASSIAFRNAILKVVPRGLFAEVFAAIRKVGLGSIRTMVENRKAALSYFAGQGVPLERVLAVIEKRKIEDIDLEDVATLRGLATAIKEGTTSIADAFPDIKPPPKPNSKTEGVKAALGVAPSPPPKRDKAAETHKLNAAIAQAEKEAEDGQDGSLMAEAEKEEF